MGIENIKFIADQIISYLNRVRNNKYRKDNRRSLLQAKEQILEATNWYADDILGYDICDFKSKYPKPKNLQYPYLIREISSISRQDILYFQLILHSKRRADKPIVLTIRWTPLKKQDQISERGRPIKHKGKRVLPRAREDIHRDRRDLRNLIIIGTNPNFDQLCLQIGIYLRRERIFRDKWALYEIFQRVAKTVKRNVDDIIVFEKLIKNFMIPNRAESLKTYLAMLLKEIQTHERPVNAPSISDLYSITDDSFPYESREILDKENEENSKNKYNDYTVYQTRDTFGISLPTLYTWIRRGKVRVPKKKNKYDYRNADHEEIEGLRIELEERRKWIDVSNLLAKELSGQRKIPIESSKRTLRRWKKKGLTTREMADKIGIQAK